MSQSFTILLVMLGAVAVELLILAALIPPTSRAYLYMSLVLIIVGYIHVRVMRYFLTKRQKKLQFQPEIGAANEKLLTSLAVAEKIQKHLLPTNNTQLPGIEFYARSRPSEQISGDYYQVIPLSATRTLIAIGDTAGHGLPSAMISIMVDTLLHAYAQQQDLREMLSNINRILYQRIDPSLFSTLLLLVWDDHTKIFTIGSAGFGRLAHFKKKTQKVHMIKSGGIALGMVPDIGQKIHVQTLAMAVGDTLILNTDGIPEMRNPLGQYLGLEQWLHIMQTHAVAESAETMFNKVSDDILEFAGTAKQVDDITLMIIRRTC